MDEDIFGKAIGDMVMVLVFAAALLAFLIGICFGVLLAHA